MSSFFLSSLGGDSSDDEEHVPRTTTPITTPEEQAIPEDIKIVTDVLKMKGGKPVPLSSLHPSWRIRVQDKNDKQIQKWGGVRKNFTTGQITRGVRPIQKQNSAPPRKHTSVVLNKMRQAKEKTKNIYEGLNRKELLKIRREKGLQFTGKKVKFL
jgi:hypothetical protein